jgi:hypothetical protein
MEADGTSSARIGTCIANIITITSSMAGHDGHGAASDEWDFTATACARSTATTRVAGVVCDLIGTSFVAIITTSDLGGSGVNIDASVGIYTACGS